MMDNLAKKGHVHEAKAIFDKMKEKKIKSGESDLNFSTSLN